GELAGAASPESTPALPLPGKTTITNKARHPGWHLVNPKPNRNPPSPPPRLSPHEPAPFSRSNYTRHHAALALKKHKVRRCLYVLGIIH
ncbi:hypothetical protein, partial [Mobiluncus mulieris]|uniref:hypothetical protein n=1 Tax=Mobiluncus mulieris TaxID=2052 RepID=UPI001B8ADA61